VGAGAYGDNDVTEDIIRKNNDELRDLLYGLIEHWEDEVVEFKEAAVNFNRENLGKYFSALSNEANLRNFQHGWLVLGVAEKTREIVGTKYGNTESIVKIRNKIADCTNNRITCLDVKEAYIATEDGTKRVVMFQIPAATAGLPTEWRGVRWAREGESTVKLPLDKEERIRRQDRRDWSRRFAEGATIEHLDPNAIQIAREKYKKKMARDYISEEVDHLQDAEFLMKLNLVVCDRVTNAAMVLLGKSEHDFLFSMAPGIMWRLYDSKDMVKDYELFTIPFISVVDSVFAKIRNLKYRYMPDQTTLFTDEIDQYDYWSMREILNNCIAHSDYTTGGRIYENEFEDRVVITNPGTFLPRDVRAVLRPGYNPPFYRNQLLAEAMASFDMIDRVTSGIQRVFNIQRERYFPMPDYDLSQENQVGVTVYGKILSQNYTRILHDNPDLDLDTVFLIDRVQKGGKLTGEESKLLRKHKLIEGRSPHLFLSARVAESLDEKAEYIRNKTRNNDFYKDMILSYLKAYGMGKKSDFMKLILPELPENLSATQKEDRVKNLIKALKNKGLITCEPAKGKNVEWTLIE